MLKRLLGAQVAMAALIAGGAQAQDVADAADSASSADIVVTAQKREERLQDVPVSVTVLGAEGLERANIDSGTEIARQTPNLRVSILGDESQPKFSLRGLSTTEFNLNAISPTGVFYDEVYVGASFLGGAQIYDLERVEVLRGPQGTLYGKNTTAGAINFISKRPTFRNEGNISAGYGEFDYFEVKGAGEAPLVDDKLTVRFAFNIAHMDNGYVENVNPAGRDLSNIDRKSGRLTIGYKDDESGFDATLRLFAVQNDARAIGFISEGTGPGGTNAFGINPRINPFTMAPLTDEQVATDRSGVIEVRGKGGYLTLNKELGAVTLTSITSYIDGRFLNLVDADGSIAPLLHVDFAAETEEVSQDLRIATNTDGPLQLIAGVYYYRDDIDISTIYSIAGGGPPFGVTLAQSYSQKRRSLAAYVDGSFAVTDAISIYAGLRYTKDKGRFRDFQVASNNPFVPGVPLQPELRYNDSEPTGRIGARLKLAPDIMAYGQFSRGYRSSAFNGGALGTPPNVARPEKLDAYEIGLKSQFLDRRLTFNASAFLYNFTDQQFVNIFSVTDIRLVNAGRSRLTGVEIEAVLRPIERLTLSAGLGLLDTEYRELVLNGVDLSGNDLIEAPHHTLNLAGDYTLPLGGAGDLTFHADATHVGSQFFLADNSPSSRIDSFWDVGARIAWNDPDKRFEIAGYVKNLTDNRAPTSVAFAPDVFTKLTTRPYPRRIGVELTTRF